MNPSPSSRHPLSITPKPTSRPGKTPSSASEGSRNQRVDAIERIATTRKDIEVVLQKLQPKGKKAEPSKNNPNKALKHAVKNLQKLTEMEKCLWSYSTANCLNSCE